MYFIINNTQLIAVSSVSFTFIQSDLQSIHQRANNGGTQCQVYYTTRLGKSIMHDVHCILYHIM